MSTSKTIKFVKIPEIDKQDLADYFNLEHGLTIFDEEEEDEEFIQEIKEKQFTPDKFKYLGLYELEGVETMFWSVEGEDICATVQPNENSICISMDSLPNQEQEDV